MTTYDPQGNAVSLEDYGEDDKLAKRVSKWQFLIKFAKLLAKFGKRALQFFECIGINAGWKCSDDVGLYLHLGRFRLTDSQFLDCATQGTPPWQCIEGFICVGEAAYRCA